jgi:hypothetical protein
MYLEFTENNAEMERLQRVCIAFEFCEAEVRHRRLLSV